MIEWYTEDTVTYCLKDGDLYRGLSINMFTGKYIILDLTHKPKLPMATKQEFDTIELAKAFVMNDV